MSLQFSICRERHSIAEFQATVRFTSPIDIDGFTEISQAVTEVAKELNLPARIAMPSFTFEFGEVGGPRLSAPTTAPGAVGFQRFAANGDVEERISADASGVTYVTRQYPGWEVIRQVLAKALGSLATHYTKRSLLVGSILVQYSNEFSSAENGFVPAQALFRKDTRWIPPIFDDLHDLWHSHVGMFLPEDTFKNLVNVNVDVQMATTADRPVEFTGVKLLIIAARQYNVTGGRPLAMSASETSDVLLANFDAAHDLEKRVLFETLSDEYLAAVNAK